MLVSILGQGSRVRPIWSHMRPNFSRVRLKKIWGRTGASSHSRKKTKVSALRTSLCRSTKDTLGSYRGLNHLEIVKGGPPSDWPWSRYSCMCVYVWRCVCCSVVVKVHRSSTWVKVQIRIIKYYSSKSKSTAFSILLEWKYKSTQFFMYLSKKVLIDRFILQFYIDYFI